MIKVFRPRPKGLMTRQPSIACSSPRDHGANYLGTQPALLTKTQPWIQGCPKLLLTEVGSRVSKHWVWPQGKVSKHIGGNKRSPHLPSLSRCQQTSCTRPKTIGYHQLVLTNNNPNRLNFYLISYLSSKHVSYLFACILYQFNMFEHCIWPKFGLLWPDVSVYEATFGRS